MKYGVVVEGVSEFASFDRIYGQLRDQTGNQFLKPLKADIQPGAPVGVVVRQCIKWVRQMHERGADHVVVLLDRERRGGCPGVAARSIEAGLAAADLQASVVLKNRMYENWLLADIDALKALSGRFSISKSTVRAVQPNKADNVDALQLLKRSVKNGSYEKVEDSKRILAKASVANIGLHSRSFRRFLRIAGDGTYGAQSLKPGSP